MWSPSFVAALLLLLTPAAHTLKTGDWKTCSQSGFCRRGRALSARAQDAADVWKSPYSVIPSSVAVASNLASFTAAVKSSIYPEINFELDVRVHKDGVVRVRMDEVGGLRKRYDEAASWALVQEPEISRAIQWSVGKQEIKAKYGEKKDVEVTVEYNPLKVTLSRNGKEEVVLNGRGLLHMEHFRTKASGDDKPVEGSEGDAQAVMQTNPAAWFEGDTEDAWWEETFSSWTDSKPKGPESLSIDINFPRHGHVYGIPQHATSLSLPTTTGPSATFTDPYRLYNADVFEYLASSSMSLYGSIPLMHAHSAESTVAVFNAVGSETWIDIGRSNDRSTETHWVSESGILDVFILPGPTPEEVFAQYARLTGTPALPAHWSLAYHQCRWNYVSSDDVRGVQKRFDEEDIPVDVFWLDIEYAEEHKYFIWDKKTFPDPVEMTNDVDALERKMVVIIDPHLKRTSSYPVYQKASELAVLVKPKSGEGEYEGWCWSGSSSWIDGFNPASWEFWKGLFKTKSIDGQWSWTESTDAVHIWNDMNEPSVFNGPEITMPKDNVHYGGWEHRDVHNINGMLFTNMTYQAVAARSDPPKRPFVLTRSFYAGSQRFGAMWTGDNLGTWEHMTVNLKMALANGIGGMTFGGSDVGGFFGNPEPEMLVRWYAIGIFSPFFRAHAHIDTKRREPYLLDEPYKSILRDTIRLRYAMLPMWYTAFREATVTGIPILRPQYVVFPKDEAGFAIDDQFYVGASGLLVKPVTEKGATEASIYLAEDQVYYDYFAHYAHQGSVKGKYVTVPAALHQIPLLVRGGSIIPTRERHRRSSPLMKYDPFTLRVALDKVGSARGELYLDDGETYSHQDGEIVWREFTAETEKKSKVLRVSSKDLALEKPQEAVEGNALAHFDPANAYAKKIAHVRVEKIVLVGLGKQPKAVRVEGGKELDWDYAPGVSSGKEGQAGVLVVKDPAVTVVSDWTLVVEL
ncbi:glycoside hydrolase family 31 protein [Serpula lacrymans var. lacrymans S7.3]|uniref:Glucosidase II subunit alpha n=2 Tax=Serpula lacrymans var. lacrymans TaxID=341189 RepID=F8PSP3_SERL3|nr:glycoside hydrolase family 31 protein [Serpula lacrymans var. lacrymans S7.9]EGO00802.1 glycoside hydrolase family 31 protein [Serpula lacrymans var. lacrymans S7.3]EGO26362.1 glycoside hydrolase family 31 protein [Serpula lacrymans var. lacrymans S7.9]